MIKTFSFRVIHTRCMCRSMCSSSSSSNNISSNTSTVNISEKVDDDKRKAFLKRYGIKSTEKPAGKSVKIVSKVSSDDLSDIEAWKESGYLEYMENQREKVY